MKSYKRVLIFALTLMMTSASHAANKLQIEDIIGHIESLENNSDPKCYATASRLEDFIYGTPLSDEARFTKNKLQMAWVNKYWQQASDIAKQHSHNKITTSDVLEALAKTIRYSQQKDEHWQVTLNTGNKIMIHKDDKRQYSSIAYSLRTLLAVQQEMLLSPDIEVMQRLPFNKEASDTLTEALDLYILSVLQVTDQNARSLNQYEITPEPLTTVWNSLMQVNDSSPQRGKTESKSLPISPDFLNSIIEQKLRSYMKYNNLKNQIFVRNLQVFFVRNRWPKDSEKAKQFRQMFTETMIAFTSDLYAGAQAIALENGHSVIEESDIFQYVQQVTPHTINEYEDAIFFPNFEANKRITIEAYDMDAFRDSGIHWRYLQFALEDRAFPIYLEPNPFAAELLVESVAQFGVLILRLTGNIGHSQNNDRIQPEHFNTALEHFNTLVTSHAKQQANSKPKQSLLSASNETASQAEGLLFTNVTDQTGISFMHRSSDWLSRLLRSYLKDEQGQGTIVIPPAFGGSGVAVGDINNDNLDDLLILSGLGNRLYLNTGNGQFQDITKASGINWLRPDSKLPGEPRQPIIADLNNDGWQDIIITYVDDVHRVYKNRKNNTFEDVSLTSALGGKGLVGGPATVFDYDNDGLLDIYITYFGNYLKGDLPTLKRRNTNGLPNKLFKNRGNFVFQDVTPGSNLDNSGWGQAVTHTDFDGDGLQDLIVGNDFGVNSYYLNLGNGKFQDIAAELGTDKPSYTMGIGLGDLNGDAISDVYISNIVTMNKDEKYVLPDSDTTMKFNPEKLAKMRVVEANDLFLSSRDNAGALQYSQSQLIGRGYSATGWAWDADFFDYDNDGDDDLYVLNGMNDYNVYSRENPYYQDPKNNKVDVIFPDSNKEANVFFVNNNGLLNNAQEESGLDTLSNARSAVYIDIDSDGDLDVVTNNYHEQASIYRNNAEKLNHNWLKIKLTGSPEHGINLDAIGAKILVQTADGMQRLREVSGTIGYMSVHSKQQHFGLLHHKVANIKVVWPNGEQSIANEVTANQLIEIEYRPEAGETRFLQ